MVARGVFCRSSAPVEGFGDGARGGLALGHPQRDANCSSASDSAGSIRRIFCRSRLCSGTVGPDRAALPVRVPFKGERAPAPLAPQSFPAGSGGGQGGRGRQGLDPGGFVIGHRRGMLLVSGASRACALLSAKDLKILPPIVPPHSGETERLPGPQGPASVPPQRVTATLCQGSRHRVEVGGTSRAASRSPASDLRPRQWAFSVTSEPPTPPPPAHACPRIDFRDVAKPPDPRALGTLPPTTGTGGCPGGRLGALKACREHRLGWHAS